MRLFYRDAVLVVERGKRARKLAADVSDPAWGVVAVTSKDRGDGAWTLDMTGNGEKAWIGRTCELSGPTREVKDGSLSQAFPYLVLQELSGAVVLVEDIADLPRVLRSAGANTTTVLTLALERLAEANATLDNYRAAEKWREATRSSAKA